MHNESKHSPFISAPGSHNLVWKRSRADPNRFSQSLERPPGTLNSLVGLVRRHSPTDVLLIPYLNSVAGDPIRLSLQPAPSLPSNLMNNVLVKLPSKEVFWEQNFQIDIYGYSTYTISRFSLTFALDAVLLVESANINSSVWSL